MGAAGAGGDTFFEDFVKLRMTMDGVDGDNSGCRREWSPNIDKSNTINPAGSPVLDGEVRAFGGASLFVGTASNNNVQAEEELTIGTQPFTLDMHLRFSSSTIPGDPHIFLDMDYDDNGPMLLSFNSSEQLQIDMRGVGVSQVLSTALTLPTSAFAHFRLTWGGLGTNLVAYFDGTAVISQLLSTGAFTSAARWYFGSRQNNIQGFGGWIDDVRFVLGGEATESVPLTERMPIASPDDDIDYEDTQEFWPLDDNNSGTYGGIINRRNLGLAGTAASDFADSPGGYGYSLRAGLSTTSVSAGFHYCPIQINFNTTDVTVELWYKELTTSFTGLLIISNSLAIPSTPRNMMYSNDGNAVLTNASTNSGSASLGGLTLSNWNHVCIQTVSGTAYYSINGNVFATASLTNELAYVGFGVRIHSPQTTNALYSQFTISSGTKYGTTSFTAPTSPLYPDSPRY